MSRQTPRQAQRTERINLAGTVVRLVFLVEGPGGIVVLFGEQGPEFRYRAGSPCPCHPITTDTYDARRQIVLVVGDGTPIVVEGWPSPPDVYAAEMSRASVQ